MAITPRTIFTNPASAAVAAASLFALTAVGMYSSSMCGGCPSQRVETVKVAHEWSPCEDVRQSMAGDQSQWSEFEWYQYASCYERAEDSSRVIEVSSQGLNYYPASEALFNLKGYHQISLQKYEDAVNTLELGLRRVGSPSNGVMTNNLAWAGLWVPRDMELQRARALYKRSLSKDSNMCETIHTGLWVEYAISENTQGLERARSLRALGQLRDNYIQSGCTERYDDGNHEQLIEVMGAAVVFEDVDRDLRQNALLDTNDALESTMLMHNVARELRKRQRGASIDKLCTESIPVASAHHTCMELIDKAVTIERHNERFQRAYKR